MGWTSRSGNGSSYGPAVIIWINGTFGVGNKMWRLDHIEAFRAARPWLIEAADLLIDTTNRTIGEVCTAIRDEMALRPTEPG